MSEILAITDNGVKIGGADGNIVDLPLAAVQFPNPKVGDQVNVYKNEDSVFVRLAAPVAPVTATATAAAPAVTGDERSVNKIAYILLTFFLGGLGVHRFMRGQIGLGIVMLLFGWLTFGIWWLVDFIISLTKLSVYPGDDYVFTANGKFTK